MPELRRCLPRPRPVRPPPPRRHAVRPQHQIQRRPPTAPRPDPPPDRPHQPHPRRARRAHPRPPPPTSPLRSHEMTRHVCHGHLGRADPTTLSTAETAAPPPPPPGIRNPKSAIRNLHYRSPIATIPVHAPAAAAHLRHPLSSILDSLRFRLRAGPELGTPRRPLAAGGQPHRSDDPRRDLGARRTDASEQAVRARPPPGDQLAQIEAAKEGRHDAAEPTGGPHPEPRPRRLPPRDGELPHRKPHHRLLQLRRAARLLPRQPLLL